MTECQGCGAWNDASRARCVLCGASLAEIDEWDAAADPPPLPPLPDGGLGAAMPAWLREPPAPPAPPSAPAPRTGEAPPGPGADPRAFLSDDDFPPWLRDLAARRAARGRHPSPPAAAAAPPAAPPAAPSRPDAAPVAAPLAHPSSDPTHASAPAAPQRPEGAAPAPSPEAAPPAASPRPDRRARDPWEPLLLAALLIGIVAAALWALSANGVLRLGP